MAAALLGAISVNSFFAHPGAPDPTWARLQRVAISDILYFGLWGLSAFPVFWACAHFRPGRYSWPTVIAGHVLLGIGIMIALELIHSALCKWLIASASSFRPAETLVDLFFLRGAVYYLMVLGIGFGRYEYFRSRERERRAQALQSRLTAARLRSLRMQINPHFFHNTLHMVSSMAGNDPNGIRTATARLGDLMRYALSTSDQHEVPLEKELSVLQSYLDIQKIRLEDKLTSTFDIAPETRKALVPTLLLQPLAENAVRHGFEGRDEPGHLHVQAARDDEELVLRVEDNGRGLADHQYDRLKGTFLQNGSQKNGHPKMRKDPSSPFPETSTGLENIAARLEGLYGGEARMEFHRSSGGGLRVTIFLPFRSDDSGESLRASGVAVDGSAAGQPDA